MILEEIARDTVVRVASEKKEISLNEMKRKAEAIIFDERKNLEASKEIKDFTKESFGFLFEKALKQSDINFICEVKKASPSKGIIAKDFPYVQIAKDYEAAGAACISVLTEPKYFLGKNEYLTEIAKNVSIPIIRKDFVIDEYQIYQAKVIGASCVLLICALLPLEKLMEYIDICDKLGLSAIVEAHDENEIAMAIRAKARIIGVNNRNLKTFEVDVHNSERLRKLVPKDILFVAESGIKTSADIEVLRKANVNGVLIGETLMKSYDKKQMLASLRGY